MVEDLFKRKFVTDPDSGTQLSDWKWLVQNGVLTRNDNLANDSESTIYTVPAGKTLYVFMMYVSFQNEAALAGQGEVVLSFTSGVAGKVNVFVLLPSKADNAHDVMSMTFPVPVKLNAGDLIQIASDRANLEAHGGFVGYLL